MTGLIALVLLIVLVAVIFHSGSTPPSTTTTTTTGSGSTGTNGGSTGSGQSGGGHAGRTGSPAEAGWRGNGKAVTLAFGGDIHFQGVLKTRLSHDATTALGPTVAKLMAGSDLAMATFDSALTDGTCPDPQQKPFVWYSPASALTAMKAGGISVAAMATDHGEDCGQPGLQMSLSEADAAHFPVIGIGSTAAQAYAAYRTTVDGQRIAVLAGTQIFPPNLQTAWTATATQPGVAAAARLVSAIEAVRPTADTVVVVVHWGTTAQTCPSAAQKSLARALVNAGADVVVGSGAHVQQGAGYLGQGYVDYGLGNLAFYDTTAPETYSGALVVTVTGRHVDSSSWRPALITDDLPQIQTGSAATTAVDRWDGLRGCTGLSANPTGPAGTSTST
ncbi:MAG TPA: CapA family protein [Acidimicrobiales bacterium]|nr:CapA family protein [Acidimicrobiales bacterium]